MITDKEIEELNHIARDLMEWTNKHYTKLEPEDADKLIISSRKVMSIVKLLEKVNQGTDESPDALPDAAVTP